MTMSPDLTHGGISRNLEQAFGDDIEMQGSQQRPKINKDDHSLDKVLPPLVTDVIVKIFAHLSIVDLTNCSLVNKAWQMLPENDSLLLKVVAFGKEKWERNIGEVEEEPPFPEGICDILRQPCPFFEGKRVYQSHMLTLIPTTVNGEPLTINSIVELVESPVIYKIINNYISGEDQVDSSKNAHWALITNDLLPTSCDAEYEYKLAKFVRDKEGYEVPKVTDMITTALIHELFQRYYWNCLLCQEDKGSRFVALGGFGLGPLYVQYSDCYVECYFGIAAQRKFS